MVLSSLSVALFSLRAPRGGGGGFERSVPRRRPSPPWAPKDGRIPASKEMERTVIYYITRPGSAIQPVRRYRARADIKRR